MGAQEWLFARSRFGWRFELQNIKLLLKELGNPQLAYKIVHVGGTNGKGSTCQFIAQGLIEAGHRVGVYLSPHLQRFSERIQVNNQEIPEGKIGEGLKQIKPLVQELDKAGRYLSFFEITTALALWYFKAMKVELAVVEVGLGGKLDATNVITPVATCITNVSLDHVNILGDTIEAIARDKSHIVKRGVPVVTGAKGKALRFVEERARQMESKIIEVNKTVKWERAKWDLNGQEFFVKTQSDAYRVRTRFLGSYQGGNLACAIAVLEELKELGFSSSKHEIIRGIKRLFLPGRSEILSLQPLILLDEAHNEAAINSVKDLLKDLDFEELILVLGIFKDKRVDQMVELIAPLAQKIIVTQPNNSRAMEAVELLEIVKQHTKANTHLKRSPADAFDLARELANPRDLILVCGSLALAGEIRSHAARSFELKGKQERLILR
jgi:dihydrofolate synthase/folylpolyglutamate synthase